MNTIKLAAVFASILAFATVGCSASTDDGKEQQAPKKEEVKVDVKEGTSVPDEFCALYASLDSDQVANMGSYSVSLACSRCGIGC